METKLFKVTTREGRFIMVAPIATIQEVYGLAAEALTRIERETYKIGFCELHFNGRHPKYTAVVVHSCAYLSEGVL